MGITGVKRESVNFTDQPKYVGLFECRVLAINPSPEEYEQLTGIQPKEDSKQFNYLGESKDGNTYLRLDFWVEDTRLRTRDDGTVLNEKFKITFFLEDKERENKDGTRKQYINNVGICSWAEDPNDLPDWFKERDYRVAYVGEEEVYGFIRTWLSKLDYKNEETVLELEWKKLMRGNVTELRQQIDGEWCENVVCLATIETTEKDGEVKEYQRIYNDAFLSPYTLKYFRTVDYMNPDTVARLKPKKSRDLKPHEKFVLRVMDQEYGCKDFFTLRDMKLYDPADNVAASDKVISEEGSDY